jgi:hypothetical protein
MIMKAPAQKIPPILTPALAPMLRVRLESDDWNVGDTNALVIVNAGRVAERASVNDIVDESDVTVREELNKL